MYPVVAAAAAASVATMGCLVVPLGVELTPFTGRHRHTHNTLSHTHIISAQSHVLADTVVLRAAVCHTNATRGACALPSFSLAACFVVLCMGHHSSVLVIVHSTPTPLCS